MYSFENLNQTLIGMSQEVLTAGVWRKTRGFNCLEIPHPVMIEITNPTDRYVTIKSRKWNKILPFAESLWMALGMNDLDQLPGRYVKNLYNFSDNGKTWRGGYGPRIRAFSGITTDYDIRHPDWKDVIIKNVGTVDQLRFVIEKLRQDINSRQAIIQIGDPAKDTFDIYGNLKQTKDYPCSRILQFMVVRGKLNCTLYIRSNDILWGLSAVNITNFTWMQEYVANILDVEIGKYYHVVNNLHVYDRFIERIKEFADLNIQDYRSPFGVWQYNDYFKSLTEFDNMLLKIYHLEKRCFNESKWTNLVTQYDMINDWYNTFKAYNLRFERMQVLLFNNPYLKRLFYEG